MSTYIIKKHISIWLLSLCMVSAVMTGTLAWKDYSQHKSNEFSGVSLHETASAAVLKLDKETGVPLEGVEFELHKTDEGGDDILVGGPFATDEDGIIWVDGLEEGDYYWLEVEPEYGWAYDSDRNGNEIREYHFTEKSDDEGSFMPIIVKAYNQRLYADLTITKKVENANASGRAETQEQAGAGQVAADEPQEPAAIEQEPGDGAQGQDWESGSQEPAPGAQEPAGDETMSDAGTEPTGESDEGSNEGSMGAVSIPEEVSGITPLSAERFEFTVTFSGIEDGPVTVLVDGTVLTGAVIVGGKLVFGLEDGQTAVIKDLPVGTEYYVEEKPVDGYIGVPDKNKGEIPLEGVAVNYINYFDLDGKLIVKKIVVGEGADPDMAFRFTVTINGEETRLSLKGGEEQEFTLHSGDLWAVYEDDYHGDGYESSYIVTHSIVDGIAVVEYTQINRYVRPDIPAEAVALPPVQKFINGNPKEHEMFGFRIVAQDGAPMPEGSDGPVKEITIKGAGKANFGLIHYTEPGEYKYTISEIITDKTGWTYDRTIYILTVTATQPSRGDMVTTQSMTTIEGLSVGDTAVFTNTYTEKPETPDKPGKPVTPAPPGTPGTPGTPDTPTGHGNTDRPKTGDNSNTWLWAILMTGSAIALRTLLLHQNQRRPDARKPV